MSRQIKWQNKEENKKTQTNKGERKIDARDNG